MRLEVLTGTACMVDTEVDAVTLRRREARFEQGSEIVILPRHGPMLVRLPECTLRYRRQDREERVAIGGGFAEVYRDHVCVLLE